MGSENLQNRAPTHQNRAQKAPREGQDDQKNEKENRPNKNEGIAPHRTPILKENVANMAPSWPPKSRPNPLKNDANIDQNIDAFQDEALKRLWWILGEKKERQIRTNALLTYKITEIHFSGPQLAPFS